MIATVLCALTLTNISVTGLTEPRPHHGYQVKVFFSDGSFISRTPTLPDWEEPVLDAVRGEVWEFKNHGANNIEFPTFTSWKLLTTCA